MSNDLPNQNGDLSNQPAGADPMSAEERRTAFSAGPPKMSRRVIVFAIAALVVLAVGGVVGDHFFPGTGSATTTTTTASTLPAFLRGSGSSGNPRGVGPDTTNTGAQRTVQRSATTEELAASLDALMGLTRREGRPAPSFSLADSNGRVVSLASLRGKVVVVSFFNSTCNDICPVLADEFRRADDLLGKQAAHVEFLTINTDPEHTSLHPVPPAVTLSGLGGTTNWDFLSAPIDVLNPLWSAYGIAISVVTATKAVSHNDVLDFIDQKGRLRYSATPFANESHNGTYSLDAATVDRWAAGIEKVITMLLKDTP